MKLPITSFTETLVRLNGLSFSKWLFLPGMVFGSVEKWWTEGQRAGAQRHNGTDLRLYEDTAGKTEALPEGTKVPLIYPGRIVRITPDFLAESIFVENDICEKGRRLFTLYGHMLAGPHVEGRRIAEGEVIGRIGMVKKSPVPEHLHISFALVPEVIPGEELSWTVLDESEGIIFLDPEMIL